MRTNKILTIFHRLFGLLFSVVYLNRVVALGLYFLNIEIPVITYTAEVGLLIGYFVLMIVHSFNHDQRRIYPILFAVMIGLYLLLPQFAYTNIFFLITYTFMFSRREIWYTPLSFIALGTFIMGFPAVVAPIGYLMVTYGWITYTIKRTA